MTQDSERDREPYTVIARVISQEGHCAFGHKVGDEVVFDGETVRGRVCLQALYSFLPMVFAMRFGAVFPWQKDLAVNKAACPDGKNPVVFEIRREPR
jgi:uncharacterized repeat protein (TIGR04076 family)